ncbi:hypothetical protein JG687_00010928, partial [Phytophthora cactorum]
MSQPLWPSAWRLTCAPGVAEDDAKWLALMKDLEELDDVELGDDEIENPFAEEQPASLKQVLLPSSIAAEDTLRTVSCEGSAASATEDAQASPSVEPMTCEHEPIVDHEPIKENSFNEAAPSPTTSVYSDSGAEMEEAGETEEPENKPKLPLPTPPPFHPITKAPNIAMPGEGYDPTFVWKVWDILDRANYEKPNEAYLVQWCAKEHRICATWVWATTLFEDGFCNEILRIDMRKDQYGHLTKMLQKKAEELEEGVSLGVIEKFLAFLRSHRAPLACNVFSKNQLNRSITSFEGLWELKLNPGVYVVGAACARQIKHCFVLRVYGDKRPHRVFDRWYEGGEDDDFYDEPLENLLWIRRCHFIFRFECVVKVV